MGLAIGTFAGPNSAPATFNMIYMPLPSAAGFGSAGIPAKAIQHSAHFLGARPTVAHANPICLEMLRDADVAQRIEETRQGRSFTGWPARSRL